MAVSSDIQKRLLYAKYLLSRARSAQSERSELGVAVCLLLMHDAVEMLMLAIVDHLQVLMPKNWKFMDFWAEIKKSHTEPPQRILMDSLNKMRVSLKHNGIPPNAQKVRDLLPRVETFCEDVAKSYLDGMEFSDLSLADLVANDDVRNTLREAQQALAGGDKDDAFTKLRIAFDKLYREVSTEVSLIRKPGKGRTGHPTLDKAVEQCVQMLNVLMLGIDPIKYRFFVSNTPIVSWTLSGKCQVVLRSSYEDVPDGVFETCFDFVVEVSLKISELFRASSIQPPN
jgi:hypothetical protein